MAIAASSWGFDANSLTAAKRTRQLARQSSNVTARALWGVRGDQRVPAGLTRAAPLRARRCMAAALGD